MTHASRDLDTLLTALRTWMADRPVDALVIPKADAHHVEWLRPHKNLVARLTGFDGSYGRIVIWRDRQVLITSGIYVEAATEALAPLGFEIVDDDRTNWLEWLAAQLTKGARVGIDPWLHTMSEYVAARVIVGAAGAELVEIDENPVDRIAPLPTQIPPQYVLHPERFAGIDAATKRRRVAEIVAARGSDACLLSAPDSICWLLNIRGNETFDAPLAFAMALVKADAAVTLFLGPEGVTPELAAHLGADVNLCNYKAIHHYGDALPKDAVVEMDAARTSEAVAAVARDRGCTVIDRPDPCQDLKAVKNPVEVAGARAAHLRDGVAQVRFWRWLDARLCEAAMPTEAEAERRIDALRAEQAHFHSVSFRTIAGTGPSGAMPHYHSDLSRDISFVRDSFFLLDSGGQFLDGTTDVTRTWAVGLPPAEACFHYTLVLKGMIDAHVLRFPEGSRGYMIDAAARRPLWTVGLDYPHGTGHGVGSFLGVHEYPIRLRTKPDPEPLVAGMITSIEPGYYAAGRYGIRLENLVCVVPDDEKPGLLGFETLTLCPFDLRPLLRAELETSHIAWLDAYHAMVRERLLPHLDDSADRDWLIARTQPVDQQMPAVA